MVSKSEKLYKDSPTLKRGEDGKMGVTKAAKKSPEQSAGPAGETGHSQEVMDMEQKHAKERMDLYHKHEKEHMTMMQKHMAAGGKDEKEGSMGESKTEKKGDADKGGKTEDKKEGSMADKDKK